METKDKSYLLCTHYKDCAYYIKEGTPSCKKCRHNQGVSFYEEK